MHQSFEPIKTSVKKNTLFNYTHTKGKDRQEWVFTCKPKDYSKATKPRWFLFVKFQDNNWLVELHIWNTVVIHPLELVALGHTRREAFNKLRLQHKNLLDLINHIHINH